MSGPSEPQRTSPRKSRKWLFLLLVLVVLLVPVGWWLVTQVRPRITRHAASELERQLNAINPGPVEIDEVEFGLGELRARGIRLFDKEGPGSPWASIDEMIVGLRTDTLLSGTPEITRLEIRGADIQMRLDEQGTWLTRVGDQDGMPDARKGLPAPEITIIGSRVTLEQPGRTTTTLDDVDATLREAEPGGALMLTGSARLLDSEWTATGEFDKVNGRWSLDFQTPSATTDADSLWALPLIPQVPDEYVRFNGTSPVRVTLDSGQDGFHYKVALHPPSRSMELAIPIAGVEFDEYEGELIIEDSVIKTRNATARWADGRATIDGDFSFAGSPLVGQLSISVSDVDTRKFPPLWQFPEFITGRLTASGELGLRITEDSTTLTATATGTARDLDVEGIRAELAEVAIDLRELDIGQNATRADGLLTLDVPLVDRDIQSLISQIAATTGSAVAELPDVDGRVGGLVKLEFPLATIDDWTTWAAHGELQSNALTVNEVVLRDVVSNGDLGAGVLDLTRFDARLLDGRATATARIELAGDRRLAGNAKLRGLSAAQIEELVRNESPRLDGVVDAELRIAGIADIPVDAANWTVDGHVRAADLAWQGEMLGSADADMRLGDEIVVLENLEWNAPRFSVRGDGKLSTLEPWPFSFDFNSGDIETEPLLETANLDVEDLNWEGPVTVNGTVTGNLADSSLSASGAGDAGSIRWRAFAFQNVPFAWRSDGNILEVTDVRLPVFDGVAVADFQTPLSEESDVDQRLVVDLKQIDFQQASEFLDLEVPVRGRGNGRVVLDSLKRAAGTTEISLSGGNAVVSEVRLSEIDGRITVAEEETRLNASGKLLDGSFSLTAATPSGRTNRLAGLNGKLEVRNVDLRRLSVESRAWAGLSPLTGFADVDMQLDGSEAGEPLSSDGTVALRDLTWNNVPLADRLVARTAIHNDIVYATIRDATLRRGRASGEIQYDLQRRQPGRFSLRLDDANLNICLCFLTDVHEKIRGIASMQIGGTIGNVIDGRGQISIDRSSIADFDLRSARGGIQFRYRPASGSGKLETRDLVIGVGDGRIKTQLTWEWGSRTAINMTAELLGVETDQLLDAFGESSGLTRGTLHGTLEIKSDSYRAFDDLRGSFNGQLVQSQALRLPVLEDVARLATPQQIGNRLYNSDKFELTLNRGIVNVRQLNLVGDLAQLSIDGTVDKRQRLDLSVIVHVGRAEFNERLVGLIDIGLVPVTGGVLPIGLLAEANQLLADRLIFLRVSGTLRRPIVRIDSRRQLRQEIVLFFINNSFNSAFPLQNGR